MTDNEIKKALECCIKAELNEDCKKLECPFFDYKLDICKYIDNEETIYANALDLINRQQAENENLEYKLLGVMHFVDKWLDGKELEQDEVNRASAMREKTLQLVEQKQAEIDRLTKRNFELAEKGEKVVIAYKTVKVEAIKEFAERLKNIYIKDKRYDRPNAHTLIDWLFANIDNLVKEMVGK